MGSLSTGRLASRRWSAAGPLSTAVSFSAGPMVRIRFPPAESLRTIGSSPRYDVGSASGAHRRVLQPRLRYSGFFLQFWRSERGQSAGAAIPTTPTIGGGDLPCVADTRWLAPQLCAGWGVSLGPRYNVDVELIWR